MELNGKKTLEKMVFSHSNVFTPVAPVFTSLILILAITNQSFQWKI